MTNAEGEEKAFVCQSAERAGERGFLAFGFYKESWSCGGCQLGLCTFRTRKEAKPTKNLCLEEFGKEKAPFVATAEKKKQEYEKTILAYNKKLEGKNSEEDESDKSKSEVNDDEVD
ncbi:hypothetical protein JHK82_054899 [Glycine max]|nr:hypothetical protein JHK82_054899 [Glycine max]